MTFALFSLAICLILLAIFFGLKACDTFNRRAEAVYLALHSVSLHLAGLIAIGSVVSAFVDAAGYLK
jgi:uncharacterized membrane protein (DUF485 family)